MNGRWATTTQTALSCYGVSDSLSVSLSPQGSLCCVVLVSLCVFCYIICSPPFPKTIQQQHQDKSCWRNQESIVHLTR